MMTTHPLYRIIVIFTVATLVNYPWELGQKPFFESNASVLEFALHCIIPSLGDGIILLLIYSLGVALFRRLDWVDRPGAAGYVLMLGSGTTIAVVVEWINVHVWGRWSYSSDMPYLPGLEVGLLPVFQMLLLPPLIFKLSTCWLARHAASKSIS